MGAVPVTAAEILRLLARQAELSEQFVAALDGGDRLAPDVLDLERELEASNEQLSLPAQQLHELADWAERQQDWNMARANGELALLIAGYVEQRQVQHEALTRLATQWRENAHGARLSTFYSSSPEKQHAHADAMERAAQELTACLMTPNFPVARPVWRHVKSGGLYAELLRGHREHDETEVVIYQNTATWQIWVRPLSEFIDGRFIPDGPVTVPT